MGRETVYLSGLTGAQIEHWEKVFRACFGSDRESPEELARSWQEGPGKEQPLPPLRERFGIAADDHRPYIFLSSNFGNIACLDEANPRAHFPFSVAVNPEMTGRDIVKGLLGRHSPDLKEFAVVCLGGAPGAGQNFTAGGFSIKLPDYLKEKMGIEPDRPVSKTGIHLAPS